MRKYVKAGRQMSSSDEKKNLYLVACVLFTVNLHQMSSIKNNYLCKAEENPMVTKKKEVNKTSNVAFATEIMIIQIIRMRSVSYKVIRLLAVITRDLLY